MSKYSPSEIDTLLARTNTIADDIDADPGELQRHACALADQLVAARAEIERMRPVVAAAVVWADSFTGTAAYDALEQAVEAYKSVA